MSTQETPVAALIQDIEQQARVMDAKARNPRLSAQLRGQFAAKAARIQARADRHRARQAQS